MNIGAVFDEDGFRSEGHDPSLRKRAKKIPMFALHWKPKGRIIPSLSIPAKSDKNRD